MKENNPLLYIGLPMLVVTFPFVWYGLLGTTAMLNSEAGIIQNETVLFLFIAIFYFFSTSLLLKSQTAPAGLRTWLIVLILGAVYFAGEEMSWGQHLFGWNSPEIMKEINAQDETNLHNISGLFDQVPRLILTIAIFIGGIVLTVYRKFQGIELDRKNMPYWLLPTLACLPIALLVILSRPVLSAMDIEFLTIGELKESLIALFIMVYGISLKKRLLAKT